MDGRPCKCGCGHVIPPAKLRIHPDQRFYSIACGLRWRRANTELERQRKEALRRAVALNRIDRWAQPSFDRILRACERRRVPLSREQMAVLKVELARAVSTAYDQGAATARVRLKRAGAAEQGSPGLSTP